MGWDAPSACAVRRWWRAASAAATPADAVVVPLAVVAVGLVLACLLFRDLGVEPYNTLFAVTVEQNIPTWFAAGLLLVTAVAALAVAALVPRNRRGLRGAWCVFAVVLGALSLDDTVSLHERLGTIGDDLLGAQRAGGLLHFTWVVPGLLAAAVVVLAVVALARQLPTHVRRQLSFGTALFFSGALGMEMVSGVVLDAFGDAVLYVLVTALEELLEMLGVVVILRGVLRTVEVRRVAAGAVELRYVIGRSRRPVADRPTTNLSADVGVLAERSRPQPTPATVPGRQSA